MLQRIHSDLSTYAYLAEPLRHKQNDTKNSSNAYLPEKIDVDTAENEILQIWGQIQFTIHFTPYTELPRPVLPRLRVRLPLLRLQPGGPRKHVSHFLRKGRILSLNSNLRAASNDIEPPSTTYVQ